MAHHFVLGLDVGSSMIKAVVAESERDGSFVLRGAFTKRSRGMRRGVVVDMEDATSAISAVFADVRKISKAALDNVWVNVDGADVRAQVSKGIVAVARANSEIYKDDIDRARQASEAINLPSNRMILHTITREFIVDGTPDIRDPLGMIGSRLEVQSLVIDAFAPSVRNLLKCIELSGGSVGGLVFNPLASARSVLSKQQRELGVLVVDIGFGTTGLALYEEDKLLHTMVFPVGAGHVTNDLAIALKVPVEVAEKIKVSYGYSTSRDVPSKETVDLSKVDEATKGTPSRRFISEIIESRLVEIFELVNNELRLLGKAGRLPAGVVLAGGGAKLPGIADLAKSELKLSSQIGFADLGLLHTNDPKIIHYAESPDFASVLGLVLSSYGSKGGLLQSSGTRFLKRLLRNFLP